MGRLEIRLEADKKLERPKAGLYRLMLSETCVAIPQWPFFSKDVSVKATALMIAVYTCTITMGGESRRASGSAGCADCSSGPELARTERYSSSSLRKHLYGSGKTGTGTGDRYRRWRRVGRVTKGNVSKSATAGWVWDMIVFCLGWVWLGI